MSLRWYQSKGIDLSRAVVLQGAKDVAIVIPTGGGKTRTAAAFCSFGVAKGSRVLWIAHRTELIDQAAATLRAEGLIVGEIQADRVRDPSAPVQVATIQTLASRSGERPKANLIVVDECHHSTAKTYRELREAYPDAVVIGLTATPQRADGTALGNVFSHMVAPVGIRQLIDEGFLVPCDVIAPSTRVDALSMDPLEAIQKHGRGQIIAFCATVNEAKILAGRANLAGITSGYVDGTQNERQRTDAIARFRSGEIRLLCNVYVCTEGFDHPPTETCLLARGCGATSTYLQMVGRVLRSSPGKERALLIDLMGIVHEHGLPDEDREYSLEGSALKTKEKPTSLRTCPQCAAVFRPKPTCPRCQYVFPPPEARRVEARFVGRISAVVSRDDQLQLWTTLCRTAFDRGWKPGWAAYRFKERTGFFPPKNFPKFDEVTREGT